jgi:SAM-dependent methyltransferase
MNTIDYYNQNAQAFYDRTINANVTEEQNKFLNVLPLQSHILDAGCGVGRDAKCFIEKGHRVVAFDASSEMVKFSTQELQQETLQLHFNEINFSQEFDGVWASASLLHVPYDETRDTYERLHQALKPGGFFYASYKYGSEYMAIEGRDFYNMNETTILAYLKELFEVHEIWQMADNRSKVAPSASKVWLNFIVRKC